MGARSSNKLQKLAYMQGTSITLVFSIMAARWHALLAIKYGRFWGNHDKGITRLDVVLQISERHVGGTKNVTQTQLVKTVIVNAMRASTVMAMSIATVSNAPHRWLVITGNRSFLWSRCQLYSHWQCSVSCVLRLSPGSEYWWSML